MYCLLFFVSNFINFVSCLFLLINLTKGLSTLFFLKNQVFVSLTLWAFVTAPVLIVASIQFILALLSYLFPNTVFRYDLFCFFLKTSCILLT